MKEIKIEETFKIPGTNIILEKGDVISIYEEYSPQWNTLTLDPPHDAYPGVTVDSDRVVTIPVEIKQFSSEKSKAMGYRQSNHFNVTTDIEIDCLGHSIPASLKSGLKLSSQFDYRDVVFTLPTVSFAQPSNYYSVNMTVKGKPIKDVLVDLYEKECKRLEPEFKKERGALWEKNRSEYQNLFDTIEKGNLPEIQNIKFYPDEKDFVNDYPCTVMVGSFKKQAEVDRYSGIGLEDRVKRPASRLYQPFILFENTVNGDKGVIGFESNSNKDKIKLISNYAGTLEYKSLNMIAKKYRDKN